MKIEDITIDKDLEALLPPLTIDESAELKASVLADGFSDPLVVWLGHRLLVDGHNRYRLWQDEFASDPDKAPEIVGRKFADRSAVEAWMIHRQLARRNLTAAQRTALALRLKPQLQAEAKERQKSSGGDKKGKNKPEKSVPKNSGEPIRSSEVTEQIAAAAGVSADTVRKVETVLSKAPEPVKAAMLSGEMSVRAAHKETTKISGGTKFDPAEIEAATVAPKKNGQPVQAVFDERLFDKPIGQLRRALDEKSKLNERDIRYFRAAKHALGQFNDAIINWRERK